MNTEQCDHGSTAPIDVLANLPGSQGGTGRHCCCVCSFQYGFEHAQLGIPPLDEMEQCKHGKLAPYMTQRALHENQGGAGRHKCTICSYQKGFEAGLRENAGLISIFKHELSRRFSSTTPVNAKAGKLQIVTPPSFQKSKQTSRSSFKPIKVTDRAYNDHRNMKLGRAGELLVLSHERTSLITAKRGDLASRIVHVSEEEGDGAGYDIRSYQPDGKLKLIEVKTTRGASETPFYITYNELEFSNQHPSEYYLYRLYDYDTITNSAKSYVIPGSVKSLFNLYPTSFRASRK